MLEVGLLIVMIVAMGRVAGSDNQSSVLWGAATLLLGLVSIVFIPLPFIRILIAGVAAFVLYIFYKVAAKK